MALRASAGTSSFRRTSSSCTRGTPTSTATSSEVVARRRMPLLSSRYSLLTRSRLASEWFLPNARRSCLLSIVCRLPLPQIGSTSARQIPTASLKANIAPGLKVVHLPKRSCSRCACYLVSAAVAVLAYSQARSGPSPWEAGRIMVALCRRL